MIRHLKLPFTLCLFFLISLMSTSQLEAQTASLYTVKQGDTLYSISKQLGVTIAELKQWNELEGNALSVGQSLTYYDVAGEMEADTAAVVADTGESILVNESQQTNTYYTVKSGDTLIKIAREHNMTLSALRELNDIQGDNIQVGQQLTVKAINYAPNVSEDASESAPQGKFSLYTVQRGESLSDLLDRYYMTESEFRYLNPDIDLNRLNRGQTVTILLPPSRNYANPYLDQTKLNDLGQVTASVYSESEAGNTTTNGELYDPDALTAAHTNIALGTILYVENPETQKGIYVRINDRVTGNALKLSAKAYRILGLNASGNPALKIYTDL